MNQPTQCLADLSVVIPVGPGETDWATLLPDLELLPEGSEVIVVGVDGPPAEFEGFAVATARCTTRWLRSAHGRARQMNFGASSASGSFLWFLHADSRIDSTAFEKLEAGLRIFPNAIHHFDLAFHSGSPPLTSLNAWGANLRSRFLGLPYGDQGLCLSKEVFDQLGGFDESLPYGEDHMLIWRAHGNRIPVKPVNAQIATSARKYARNGWLRTTCLHLWLTVRQAVPQFARLVARKRAPITYDHSSRQDHCRLIIFTRCPEVGRCKTRLIPALGEDRATEVHEELVKRTMKRAAQAIKQGITIEVRYAGEALERLRRVCGECADQFDFQPQHGLDLGQRLSESSATAFREGASKVAIIGTDCPQLTVDIIHKAFTLLDHTDVVLGPASDGGYYLIATRAHHSDLFNQIAWGECTVLTDTINRAKGSHLRVELLPILADLDRSEDLALLTH